MRNYNLNTVLVKLLNVSNSWYTIHFLVDSYNPNGQTDHHFSSGSVAMTSAASPASHIPSPLSVIIALKKKFSPACLSFFFVLSENTFLSVPSNSSFLDPSWLYLNSTDWKVLVVGAFQVSSQCQSAIFWRLKQVVTLTAWLSCPSQPSNNNGGDGIEKRQRRERKGERWEVVTHTATDENTWNTDTETVKTTKTETETLLCWLRKN